MGAFASRRNSGVQTVDIQNENAYKYPPKSGNYFGSYFMMGGERFDMQPPEAYLFGDNADLNYLGNKPISFPYPISQSNEPTKTLKSLVYIRKDSLKFVKAPAIDKAGIEDDKTTEETDKEKEAVQTRYNIEFCFDADARCAITIYYFAKEDIINGQIVYKPTTGLRSDTYHYKRGSNQTFSQPGHVIDPREYNESDWQYSEREIIPVAIHCSVQEEDYMGHSHMTYAVAEKSQDGGFNLKALKQKQFVDGLPYLLQEIYGIENKHVDREKIDPDDDPDDSGSECVICMGERRDTLILPCRHLCLCSNCAESLRYQCSYCPICRSAFRALLQIRAMRKKPLIPQPQCEGDENKVNQEGVPPGYEAMSLIEALNGPCGGAPYPPTEHVPPVRFAPPIDSETSVEKRKPKKHSSPGHKRRHKPTNEDSVDGSDDKTKDKHDEAKHPSSQDIDPAKLAEDGSNIVFVRFPSLKGSPTNAKIPSGEEADEEDTENGTEEPMESSDIPVLAASPKKTKATKEDLTMEEYQKLYIVSEDNGGKVNTQTETSVEIPPEDYDEEDVPVNSVQAVVDSVRSRTARPSRFSGQASEFAKLASGISSGHMADDELEDTTDGEPERDSDAEGKSSSIESQLNGNESVTEETGYKPASKEKRVDGYQAFQIASPGSLSETAGSLTETSGTSSSGSSQNLLPHTLTDIDFGDET